MAPILFKIGPFALYSLWVALCAAFLIGTLLFLKRAKYQRIDLNFILDHSLSLLLGAVLGSRLIFFLMNWGYYGPLSIMNTLKHIFFFWQPGYSFWGGVLGVVIVFLIHAFRKRENPIPWLDSVTMPFLIGMMITNVGQLLDGQGYGKETILPWGITFESTNVKYTVPVHPTQIYSILLIMAIIGSKKMVLEKWPQLKEESHWWSILALAEYSFGRFLIEFFRGDDTVELFGVRLGQIVAFFAFVGLATFLYKNLKKNTSH